MGIKFFMSKVIQQLKVSDDNQKVLIKQNLIPVLAEDASLGSLQLKKYSPKLIKSNNHIYLPKPIEETSIISKQFTTNYKKLPMDEHYSYQFDFLLFHLNKKETNIKCLPFKNRMLRKMSENELIEFFSKKPVHYELINQN